jgi:hypothetical protein
MENAFMAIKPPKWIWKEKRLENFATDQYAFQKIKTLA